MIFKKCFILSGDLKKLSFGMALFRQYHKQSLFEPAPPDFFLLFSIWTKKTIELNDFILLYLSIISSSFSVGLKILGAYILIGSPILDCWPDLTIPSKFNAVVIVPFKLSFCNDFDINKPFL